MDKKIKWLKRMKQIQLNPITWLHKFHKWNQILPVAIAGENDS